jgi:hypothetical protein
MMTKPSDSKIGKERTGEKEQEQQKDQEWRKLCDLVAREPDPQRLSQLVDQLIQALDARTQSLRHGGEQTKPAPDDK